LGNRRGREGKWGGGREGKVVSDSKGDGKITGNCRRDAEDVCGHALG